MNLQKHTDKNTIYTARNDELIQELTASAARHSASDAARCFILKGNQAFNFRLAAANIYSRQRHAQHTDS